MIKLVCIVCDCVESFVSIRMTFLVLESGQKSLNDFTFFNYGEMFVVSVFYCIIQFAIRCIVINNF